MSEKTSVPISAVAPSGQNPRQDFGDIEALARTIRATGGQPVNPIVVVRDGDAYRIVDGERRYRALVELGAKTADVLVCDDWGEAEEAVAMVATDNKKGLTEEERARGFQSMLALGVSDEVAGAASGLEPSVVRRVRRAAIMAPEQTTLDAMIAASEFDDERDRAKVLKADDPERCACRIREERKCEAARAEVRTLVAGVGLDVEWMGGPAPWPYGCKSKKTRGLAYAMKVGGEGDVETLSKRFSGERLVAWASGLGWDVWRRLPEDADERERQKAALEGLREASASACKEFAASVARWISGRGSLPRDLASLVRADRTGYSPARVLGVEVDSGDSALAAILDSEPSVHEAVSYLDKNMPWGIRKYDGSFDEERARWVDDVWEAIVCEGWADNEARAMGEELDACWRSLETEKSS